MSRRFLVAGAFDRFNFGDLLFPRVWQRALQRRGEVGSCRYFSTQEKDLSGVGGVETHSLDSLRAPKSAADDLLVFAGGEILDAGWTGTYAALSTPRRAFAIKALDRTLGAEPLARYLVGSRRALPWVTSAAETGGLRAAYWAVGGSGLARLPTRRQARIRGILADAADLSVRDPRTLAVLRSWGLKARLAPDGAVLASEVFPREELLRDLSAPATRLLKELGAGSYLCLQLGRYPSRGHLEEVAGQLKKLRAARALPILLLPLGLAPAHEDDTALAGVERYFGGSSGPRILSAVNPSQPLSVTDILALIASARLFAGTSLHGNLTALTYGVPRVGLGPGIRKLDLFLRTWDPSQPHGCAPFSELSTRALAALNLSESDLDSARRRVVEAGWENLNRLLETTAAPP